MPGAMSSKERKEHLPVKFAVLSHIFPPSPSGQAVMLYRILRGFDPENYCLIVSQDRKVHGSVLGQAELPARRHEIWVHWRILKINLRFTWRLRMFAGKIIDGFTRLFQLGRIARILKREGCGALVACTGDLFNLPIGYLAARRAGVRFYAYLFDDYAQQWRQFPGYHFLARRAESFVLKRADGVIVPNEFLQEEYRNRYGIEAHVIHNPCGGIERDNGCPWPAKPDEIRIVYTGSIYRAHYDAFHNLFAAMKILDRPDLRLHVYTPHTEAKLKRRGIAGPVIYHEPLGPRQIAHVQRQADILFLPLAFNSPFPKIIRTSAPGKLGDFLAAGRPILAHAPADSFVSWYFREHKVGPIVDQPDPEALAQAIRKIIDGPKQRQKWRDNALRRAEADFEPAPAQARFLEVLQLSKKGE